MKRPEGITKPEALSGARKPRVLIAGEFSAGKTQLINGLVGEMLLPSNVTSTSLPPVWIAHGAAEKSAVDLTEQVHPRASFDGISVSETLYCLLSSGSDFVSKVELIDTPGNSDPNIPSECWERMLDYADMVVWCTNATQAWRQSEKAVWDDMPEHLRKNATLLITHADRLADTRSRDRVLRRLKREAGSYFDHFMMASLLNTDDLTAVGSHVHDVAEALETLPGVENKIVKAFADGARKRLAQADVHPVKPRRISTTRRKSKDATPPIEPEPQLELEAPAETGHSPVTQPEIAPESDLSVPLLLSEVVTETLEEQVQSATIHSLKPNAADALEPRAAKAYEAGPRGKARALWGEISDGVDVSDASALLSCVERFIDRLDEARVPLEDVPEDDAADSGSIEEHIQSLVGRSQL